MFCSEFRGPCKLVLASASLWLTTMPLHKLQHGRVHEVRHLVHGAVTRACTGTHAIQRFAAPVPPATQWAFDSVPPAEVWLLCSADLQKQLVARPALHSQLVTPHWDPASQVANGTV